MLKVMETRLCERVKDSYSCALQSDGSSCHTLSPSCHRCTVAAFLALAPPQRPAAATLPPPLTLRFFLSELFLFHQTLEALVPIVYILDEQVEHAFLIQG